MILTLRAFLGSPVWKPFLKRRGMSLRVRMRPVPTVFLRLPFSLQLTALRRPVSKPCQNENESPPRLEGRIEDGMVEEARTLARLSSGETAGGALLLLDVQRATTYSIPRVSKIRCLILKFPQTSLEPNPSPCVSSCNYSSEIRGGPREAAEQGEGGREEEN